jgi:hypothetical protein
MALIYHPLQPGRVESPQIVTSGWPSNSRPNSTAKSSKVTVSTEPEGVLCKRAVCFIFESGNVETQKLAARGLLGQTRNAGLFSACCLWLYPMGVTS